MANKDHFLMEIGLFKHILHSVHTSDASALKNFHFPTKISMINKSTLKQADYILNNSLKYYTNVFLKLMFTILKLKV